MPLQVNVHRTGAVLVVRVGGELDLTTAALLRDPIEQAWASDDSLRHVVLNVKDLSFLDSAGIAVILGRYRAATARGGRMVLSGANARVRRMLELAGALRLVELVEDENQAVARLSRRNHAPSRERRRRRSP